MMEATVSPASITQSLPYMSRVEQRRWLDVFTPKFGDLLSCFLIRIFVLRFRLEFQRQNFVEVADVRVKRRLRESLPDLQDLPLPRFLYLFFRTDRVEEIFFEPSEMAEVDAQITVSIAFN